MLRPARSHLATLLPLLASVVACGGSIASVEGTGGAGGGPENGTSGTSGAGGTSASGGTTATTGGSSTSTSSSGGAVAVDLCNGDSYHPLEGVTGSVPGVTAAIDYLELREVYPSLNDPSSYKVLANTGTRCGSARNQAACEKTLQGTTSSGWRMEVEDGFRAPGAERYIVLTAGDQVRTVATLEDLRAFLAPIENAHDAALLVTASGKYRIASCASAQAKRTPTGWEISVESGHTCGPGTKIEGHVIAVESNGAMYTVKTQVLEEGNPNCAIGRRPEGLVAQAQQAQAHEDTRPNGTAAALARFFAEAAHLEAASVYAFDRLAQDLVRLGAPRALASAARTSREDEVRHARMTRAIAERFGGRVLAPVVAPLAGERTPLAIALENAVEGCVRETYGALVAHWQAAHAEDRAIGAAMEVIAEDETAHASLAWDVAEWLEARLSNDDRRAVEAARTHAIAALREELARPVDASLVRDAGVPCADAALALLDALAATHLSGGLRLAA
jgi:hypothetical protein